MKILWYILKFPEISGELSGELQPAKKFSSPTPAKSDFLLSAEISGDLLETEISTTLILATFSYSPKLNWPFKSDFITCQTENGFFCTLIRY